MTYWQLLRKHCRRLGVEGFMWELPVILNTAGGARCIVQLALVRDNNSELKSGSERASLTCITYFYA